MKVSRIEVDEVVSEEIEGLSPWYVSWSGVWVGALSAVALLLVFGLTGIAVGAHQLGRRIGSWHEFRSHLRDGRQSTERARHQRRHLR